MKKVIVHFFSAFLPVREWRHRFRSFFLDKKVPSEHALRINRIAHAIGAKSYLEIGVNHGGSFFPVSIDKKIAVDPKFHFDAELHRNVNTLFYEMTSDDFFGAQKEKLNFDIYFLDGLHVFEQTLRDLENALLHAHDKSVFILDDVYPCDRFSVITDPEEAFAQRQQHDQENNGAWHGDIFKMCFYIHDLMPQLSYAVNISEGNGILVAWLEARKNIMPRFQSLEAISRATFDDFLNNQDVFNIQPMDAIVDMVKKARNIPQDSK